MIATMDTTAAFTELRKQALAKRNAAHVVANKEYQDTLSRINALEQDITGRVHTLHRKMTDCIMEVMPKDKPFTTQDIWLSLKALDSSRDWIRRSIDCHITRLREKGYLKRLRRHHGRDLAVYAFAGGEVADFPFGDKTLLEAMQDVLRDSEPLRPPELTVKLLESGFYTRRSRKDFRASVGSALNTNPELFVRGEAGKWILAG